MYLMWDAVLGVNLLASNNSLFRLTLEAGIFPEKKISSNQASDCAT
jgi:hypothetical protein